MNLATIARNITLKDGFYNIFDKGSYHYFSEMILDYARKGHSQCMLAPVDAMLPAVLNELIHEGIGIFIANEPFSPVKWYVAFWAKINHEPYELYSPVKIQYELL